MNRFDRVTAILIQLQSKRVVKAQDLAERYEVSLRTIYRDIKSLEQAGVPLYGEAGMGYSMADGYRLPPVMFTREEAMAFLTAEKLTEQLTDRETAKNYGTAMSKIRSVLRMQEKDYLEEVEEKIIVRRKFNPLSGKSEIKLLPTILEAIAEKEVLAIRYFSFYQQEKTSRCIEPMGIVFENNNWHLIAFCRLRKAYRNFRIDRIDSLRRTGEHFEDEHPSFSGYLELMRQEQSLHKVVIHMDRDISRYVEQEKYYYGFVKETEADGVLEMTFMSRSLEGFARWLMMFGPQAKVIHPEILKEKVRALALAALEAYK